MKKLFIIFLCFFGASSYAVDWNKNTDFLWHVGTGRVDVFPGQGVGNVWSSAQVKASVYGPTIERQKLLPFNPSPSGNFKAMFSPGSIAKGLLNPTSAAVTLVGAVIINRALEAACIRAFGGSMQLAPGGQWEQCNFIDQVNTQYKVGTSPNGIGSTPGAACSDAVAKHPPAPAVGRSFVYESARLAPGGNVIPHCFITQHEVACSAASGCYAYPSTEDAFSITSSSVTEKVKDGYKPATGLEAQAALEPVLTQWSQADFTAGRNGTDGDMGQLLDQLMQSGNSVDPDITVSGPVTSPSTTSTTVDSVANTTTTATTTNKYSYGKTSPVDSSVVVTQSTTNVTVNNSTGAVTNNTTTTVVTPDQKPTDPCVSDPDTMGCSKFGVPDAPVLPKVDSGFTGINPVAFTSSASCPSDLTFNVLGRQQAISYLGACSALETYIKPLLVLLSVALAAWIFAGGFKV